MRVRSETRPEAATPRATALRPGVSVRYLRFDPPHAAIERHAAPSPVSRRRVRQVLAVPALCGSSVAAPAGGGAASFRVRGRCDAATDAPATVSVVMRRFRENYSTLSHIAGDPLVWDSSATEIRDELRETITLAETALKEFASTPAPRVASGMSSSIVLLAGILDERVDVLFDRVERLRQRRLWVFHWSAMLEAIPVGIAPRSDEIGRLACEIIDDAAGDDAVTLVQPESADRAVRVAAHSVNVAQIVARLAGVDPSWRDESVLAVSAALLADAGLMQMPLDLLESNRHLTATQRTALHQHPAASAAIVDQMRGRDERLVAAVLQHHERLDGSGYPDRTGDDAINSVARLLAVADTYVGMQSPRSYRPALSAEQAMAEIDRAAAEGRLDADWVARLPARVPEWLKISAAPLPPSGAPSLSALAA